MRYLGILLLPYLSSSKNPCIMTYMQYYLMRYEIVDGNVREGLQVAKDEAHGIRNRRIGRVR
jgi:hypothetical protein